MSFKSNYAFEVRKMNNQQEEIKAMLNENQQYTFQLEFSSSYKFQRINNNKNKQQPETSNTSYAQIHQQKVDKLVEDQFRNNRFSSQQKKENQQKTIKNKFTHNPQPEDKKIIDAQMQNNYDIIEISNNDEYDKLLIYTNILFYYNKNQQNLEKPSQSQVGQHKIRGKLYNTLFDYDNNPTYIIQEGEFLVDLYKKQFKLDGQGVEYQGKSNQKKIQGEFIQGVQAQRIPSSQNKSQYKSFSVEPTRIKIKEITDGYPIQTNNRIEKKSIWCKYNQQFNERDLDILQQPSWLNSSIIDCYVLSLNKKSEEEYFKLSQDNRKQIKRIYFVTSSLITNFGKIYNIQHATELFQKHFLEFQEAKYMIQTIYSKIGFPVVSNSHWYFLLFDLNEKKVEIFNSLSKSLYNQGLITSLSELLMLQNPEKSINMHSGKQRDGYSCGYHVCCFMKACYEAQFSNSFCYQYDEKEMRGILRNLINYQDNKLQ